MADHRPPESIKKEIIEQIDKWLDGDFGCLASVRKLGDRLIINLEFDVTAVEDKK